MSEKEYLCDIGKAVRIHQLMSQTNKSQFDVFPIVCSGYQKGYSTLLREKVERISEEKEKKEKGKEKSKEKGKRFTLKKRKV